MREYHELLLATSRTFAVGIDALPRPLREAVTLAYLVLRVSDYFEDSPSLTTDQKRAALDLWADLIEGSTGGSDPTRITRRVGELRAAVADADERIPDRLAALKADAILEGVSRLPPAFLGPIREHTVGTTRGMARWILRGADFPDEAALDDYMFEVAGRVGLLLTELFAAHSPAARARRAQLMETAVSFGLGLQTVNVIRGLHEDPDRGWNYVPRHVLSPRRADGALFDPPAVPDLRALGSEGQLRVLDFLVGKAGSHIGDALAYCRAVPRVERGIRIFCIIPALLALRTAEASRRNPRTFVEPVKVGRLDVRRLVLAARLLYFSDRWIRGNERRARSLAFGLGALRPARDR
jgi:farnesyl-diphosphate farnesyltransferase